MDMGGSMEEQSMARNAGEGGSTGGRGGRAGGSRSRGNGTGSKSSTRGGEDMGVADVVQPGGGFQESGVLPQGGGKSEEPPAGRYCIDAADRRKVPHKHQKIKMRWNLTTVGSQRTVNS